MATDVIKQVVAISADLTALRSDLARTESEFKTAFGRIQRVAGTALGSLGVGVSAGALIAFAKNVTDVGDQLSDLADQTGNSIALLGGIKPVLEANNSSLESFAKGMSRVQKALGDVSGDGKEAAEGFKALGLDIEKLRALNPDQFIETFVNALGKVEDRNNRAAIANKILGRSFAELLPTILTLSRDGIQKLDADTAKAYETLGAFKDQAGRLLNTLMNVSAAPLADSLTALKVVVDALGKSIYDLNIGIERTSESWLSYRRFTEFAAAATLSFYAAGLKILRIAPQLAEALTLGKVDFNAKGFTDAITGVESEIARLQGASKNRQNLIGASIGGMADLLPAKAAPKLFQDTASAAKKAKSDVDNFFDGLTKQLATLENKKIELKFGEQAGLAAQLDAQFAAFKDNLRDKQMPIPKGLDVFFTTLKDKILAGNDELRRMQYELGKLDELGKAFSQDSAEWGNVGEDLEKVRKEREPLIKQMDELRQQLQLGAIDQSTPGGKEQARIAGIVNEYENTKKKIEELGLQMGASQEQTAQDVALAWQKALNDINTETDELTKFQERAFERMHDTLSDLFRDFLGGEIKSIKDVTDRLQKVFTDFVSEFAALQLKTTIFGANYGKAGGQMGGLLGQLFGAAAASPQVGYGARPTGPNGEPVQGPLLPNGGFYSTPQGIAPPGFAPMSAPSAPMGGPLGGLLGSLLGGTGFPTQTPPFMPQDNCGCGPGGKLPDWITDIQNLFKSESGNIVKPVEEAFTEVSRSFQDDLTDMFDAFADDMDSVLDDIAQTFSQFMAPSTTGGSSGGMGGLGGLFGGVFGGLFGGGGGASTPIGGAFDVENLMWGSMAVAHAGGPVGADTPEMAKRLTMGLRSDERLIIGQKGEFMMSKDAVAGIGMDRLKYANEHFTLPRFHEGGPIGMPDMPAALSAPSGERADRAELGAAHYHMHVHGATNPDEFRRSQAQWEAGMARAVRKGQKRL